MRVRQDANCITIVLPNSIHESYDHPNRVAYKSTRQIEIECVSMLYPVLAFHSHTRTHQRFAFESNHVEISFMPNQPVQSCWQARRLESIAQRISILWSPPKSTLHVKMRMLEMSPDEKQAVIIDATKQCGFNSRGLHIFHSPTQPHSPTQSHCFWPYSRHIDCFLDCGGYVYFILLSSHVFFVQWKSSVEFCEFDVKLRDQHGRLSRWRL